MEEFRMWIMQI